jgi:ribonuclease HI
MNPYALYINCDGAMDYSSENPGGIGFIIRFPESVHLEDIFESIGTYIGANIERIELEALIQAILRVIKLFETHKYELRNIRQIIFITDRFALCDAERTNPFQIRNWRQNNWYNHEGKPIKNHLLLDKLDKTRRKLTDISHARINIEFRSRKQNKGADKLAKAAKKGNLTIRTLAKKIEKIGKRMYDGAEISYKTLSEKQEIHINVFRKDPVQDEWEVWVEICEGENLGKKLKIYTDNKLAEKLQRGNQYVLKLKKIHRFHVLAYSKVKKYKINRHIQ